jgi:hypothetical protein
MKVNTAGLFSLSHMPPPPPAGEQPPPVPTDAQPDAPVDRSPRVRTTTLERFDHEMSALDHPLDEEVEYYDEPKLRRWRVPAIGMAIFALTCGGYLSAARYLHAPQVAAKEPTARPPAGGAAAAVPAPLPSPPLAVPAPAPMAAVPATETLGAVGADKPAAPAEPIALDDPKTDGHHHRHGHHARGRHHHGSHAHHSA